MKSNDYCIKLIGSTSRNDKVEIIIPKCCNDDVVVEGLPSISDHYSKSKRDSPDMFLLEIFDGIESIGCCTFVCSLKCLEVNFIFIMNQYRGKKLALWVWSILEDISFLYYEARKPIYLIFVEMDLYNIWQTLLNRYLVAKIVHDDIETIDDALISEEKVILKLNILIGVIYPRRNFKYTDDYKDLKVFIHKAMEIDGDIDHSKIVDASKWCGSLLHGNASLQYWMNSQMARVWLTEKENDNKNSNILSMILEGEKVPLSMILLPTNNFDLISTIFHDGAVTSEAIRMFFILYYNVLAKMPKRFLKNKSNKDYNGFLKETIQIKENINSNFNYKELPSVIYSWA
jgi:hypothetical protein